MAPETLATPADRLATVTARAYGAIQGISNCAQDGLISTAAMSELHDRYSYRVNPLMESASHLRQTAALVRRLVSAAERIGD